MRINDFYNIIELVKSDVLSSEDEYLKLMRVIGNNQRYDFLSQLSIYDKNPNTTACASFDVWRERFNRIVMRGQRGITVINNAGTFQKVGYIFDISQTISVDKNVNEVELWSFDREIHSQALKDIINTQGYSTSESLTENLYTLGRIYSDESIYKLANNLRIAYEDRNSFIHFIRNSICYAVSDRFNHNYPIDKDNVRENLRYLDSISLMSVGACISNAGNKIIESTMKMTRSLSVNSVLTKNIGAEYNIKGKENKNLGGNVNAVRSNDQRYDDNAERIFKNGEYGRDNRQNQRDNFESIGTTGRLHQGISQSDLRYDEIGLLGTEQTREQIQDVDRHLQGGQADKPLDGYSTTGNQLYEERKAETDKSLEYRERGKSSVQGDDIGTKRNDNQGSGGSLENIENLAVIQTEGADDAYFFNAEDNSDILMADETAGNDENLSTNFANEVDKAVDEYEMMKDEAISRIATLKLELALQYTNIDIDDFSDEQLEEIMSAIKLYDFYSNEIAKTANPRLSVWKMEQLKWLIDDMKKGEVGITSEKIKYLKALDIDIAKFNVLKDYLVRDKISIRQIDEIKKDISFFSMSEFVENLKAYAKKMKVKK